MATAKTAAAKKTTTGRKTNVATVKKATPTRRRTTAAQKAATDNGVELALIPVGVKDLYIDRYVDGNITGFQMLDLALSMHLNVLLEGPTGSSKTTFVEAFAEHRQMPFYSLSSFNGADIGQLLGKFVMQEDGSVVWIDGPVTHIVRHGGLLLINEVNFLPERLSTVLFSLLDRRRLITLLDHKGEVVKAHPNTMIVADMNPDYEGTRRLNKAFRNRFPIQQVWDYDPTVEAQLVTSQALLSMATSLRLQHREGKLQTPTATNMLMEFESLAKAASIDFAMSCFINHYAETERQAVQMVCTTFKDNIVDELDIDADDESADWDDLRV